MTLVPEVKYEETDLTLENMNVMTLTEKTVMDDPKNVK